MIVFLCIPSFSVGQPGRGEEAARQLDEVMQDPLFSRWELRSERSELGEGSLSRSAWLKSYRDRSGELLESFFDWLFNRNRPPSPSATSPSQGSGSDWGGSLGDVLKLVGWALLIGVVLLSLWMIFSQIRNRQRVTAGSAPDRLTLDTAMDESDALAAESSVWAQHAQQLVHEENLRLAFRAMYLALLSGLHQEGKIRYRPQRTNNWYVRGYRGRKEERRLFASLTERFGEIWYGQEIPDRVSFDQVSREVDGLLRSSADNSDPRSGEGGRP